MNFKQDQGFVNISPARIKKSQSKIKKGTFYFVLIGGVTTYLANNYNIDLIFHYKPTLLNQQALENCRELRKGKFRPTWFLPTSFMQCVYGAKFDPTPYVPYDRERVQLHDGGALYLDWGPVFKSLDKEDTKVLLITHGLTGSADCNYIKEVVLTAQSNGFRTVALNMRGFGDTPVIETPNYYNFADTSDLRTVVAHIKEKFPKADLYGLGISIGANYIVKYAGETKENCQFKALVSLANPYDLEKCSYKIEHWSKGIYEWSLVNGFKRLFAKNQEMLVKNTEHPIDPKAILASKTCREFDSQFTAKINGYHDVTEYYKSVGCEPYLKDVRIPVMFINSLQDPVIDKSIIPKDEIKKNGNLLLVETPQGGHIDWFTTRWPKRWAFWPAMEYLMFVDEFLRKPENRATLEGATPAAAPVAAVAKK